jgi:glucose-1-phosphate cytidylyltransferase
VKVVLFCGGLGLRMGPSSRRVPKPMVRIGGRPILWHIMSLYASHGFRDFVLCVGHRADVIVKYFERCEEVRTGEWAIDFVDTGSHASVGERLRRVGRQLEGEELFLANYGDVLTDAPLDRTVDVLRESGKTALVLAVRPRYNFHVLDVGSDSLVSGIRDVMTTDLRINGGFFVFRREVLSSIREREDLVEEPFRRLIAADQLLAYPYDGFWAPMDTLKDQQLLETLHSSGKAPWLRSRKRRPLRAKTVAA